MDHSVKGKTSRKPSDKHSRRDKAKSTGADGNQDDYYTTFLFTVNELVIDGTQNWQPKSDGMYNTLPPVQGSGYRSEIASPVMRYENGNVSNAEDYYWYRDPVDPGNWWNCGSVYTHYKGYEQASMMDRYSEFAVFSCNNHLPFIVRRGDPTTYDARSEHFAPLLFAHPRSQPGVSHLIVDNSPMEGGAGELKYVAGKKPSWIPSLVPGSYENPRSGRVQSSGLSGELGILIGLMAFNEPQHEDKESNNIARIFLGADGHRPKWRGGKWHHSDEPKGIIKADEDGPRGFLVSIFLDPENQEGSTEESLSDLQWNRVLVQESTSSTSHRRS